MDFFARTRPDDAEIDELIAWRHELHRHPELSREEGETARRVVEALGETGPDRLVTGLGGHGVAAVYDSGAPGPSVMFRAELDALPIEELGEIAHRSRVPGKAHLCGHDGHCAILIGFGRLLGRVRPARGRVILLFQPAEEDGSGAAAVVTDPRFDELRHDFAFALHNKPGVALGEALLPLGPANCASRGMRIRLRGATAHAARPETGRSPMRALARLMPALEGCATAAAPGTDFTLVTVTHASMGAPAYGVAPGDAEIRATLRTVTDEAMAALAERAEDLVRDAAAEHGLDCEIAYEDDFLASINHADAVALLHEAIVASGLDCRTSPEPQRGSEDFGRFGAFAKSAMVFLGAGTDWPQVHTPKYDFPDALIGQGLRLFAATLDACLRDQAVDQRG